MTNTRLFSQDSSGIKYTVPGSTDGYVVTFKTSKTSKDVGGFKVPNHKLEVFVNTQAPVTVSSTTCTPKCGQESLSVRIIVSGSPQNKNELDKLVAGLSGQMVTWFEDEYVFDGYAPETAPLYYTEKPVTP